MNWLALLKLLLTVTDRVFSYMEERQMLEAGEARAIAKQMEDLNERVKRAAAARDATRADNAAGGLRNDDGYRLD